MIKRIFSNLLISLAVFALIFLGLNLAFVTTWLSYKITPENHVINYSELFSTNEEQLTLSPNTLFIPDLGIKTPIQFPTQKNESSYQTALQSGVALFPGSALPGAFGKSYIFGHSSDVPWNKGDYKNVFALLPNITPNMPIYITGETETIFLCKVSGTAIVKPTETKLTEQPIEPTTRELVLQTSYPIGTAFRRFVVFSVCNELQRTQKEEQTQTITQPTE